MAIDFDFTIRLGDLVTMVGLFGGGIAVVLMQRADIRVLAQRVGAIEMSMKEVSDEVNGFTKVLIKQARHEQRIDTLEQELRDMRRRNDDAGYRNRQP